MQCVVLAGGLATRLRPVTETLPKILVPVGGRPFADLQLGWLAKQGVTDVVLAIGYLGEQVREHVGDGSRYGLRVAYADEGRDLKGTAGALRLAYDAGMLEPRFCVLYGDSYLQLDVPDVVASFDARDGRAAALMTVYRNEGRFDTSNARLQDGWVVVYDKDASDPQSSGLHWIDYGFSVLDREAVVAHVPPGEVADLAPLLRDLSNAGRLAGYEVTERFYEIGSHRGLAELEAHINP